MMHGGGMGGGAGRWGSGGLDQGPPEGRPYDHKVVVRLMAYFKPYWRQVVLTALAMFVYSATIVALPWIVKWTIDSYIATEDGSGITKGDLSGLNLVVLAFVSVAFLQYVSNYSQQRMMARLGQRVLYTLRIGLFNHLQGLSMSFFDRNQVGILMSRVQNDVQQLQVFLEIFLTSLANVLSLAGIIAAMAIMSPRLALITLSVVPPLFLVLVVWQRYARRPFMRVRQAIAVVNSGLQENISGVRVVQSLNREKANTRRFGRANFDHLDANLQASRLTAALLPSVEILTAVGLALVVFVGGGMVLDESLEVGVLVAFALYVQRFFEPVRQLTMEYGQLQRAMAAGAHIFELMDEEPEVADRPEPVELAVSRGEVRFEGVGFHYGDDKPVLQGIDLHIRPGETVALVGATGAGKTTMVSLLMRLYDVTDGRITLDGHDIRDVSLESLARQMSVVTQEPFLFSGSVEDNIRYNRSRVSHGEVVDAARAIGAHEFITRLEKGYETPLQERGGNLSVGQRQLVSFARALVADPRILILDEATANIDTYTEMLIQWGLRELLQGRTALVIAHRLSTIRNADNIVVLDQGRIVERGTHSELIAREGVYERVHRFTGDGVGEDGGQRTASARRGPDRPRAGRRPAPA